jgi:pimeloyl-ACP methyl ester carboxylesterase
MQLFLRALGLVVAGVVFFGLLGVYLTWAPDKPVEALSAQWAQPPSQFMALQGMQVHLRDEGPRDDPLPIVLLHGTSASLHTWQGWAEALRGQRRVIRMDLPGFALTGPNPENDYSIERYVAFVTALADQLGVQRFVLGGNSLGGQIAWATAVAHPQRVASLILVDASGYAFESAKTPIKVPLGFVMASIKPLAPLVENTLPRGLVDQSVKAVYGDPAKVTPALVNLYYDISLRAGNRKALLRRLEQGYTGDTQTLGQLKLPTLILWGGRDRLIPLEFGERFARDIGGSKLVVFDGLGHVPHEEDPAATVAEVKRFLGM